MIWLIADQWRAQAIGANGDPNVHAPNIDRLAQSGTNFDQARSGIPSCCPFRGSMLTSRYPNYMVPGHEYPLPQGQQTVANLFNDAGYHTGYFGKWHLDGFHEKDGRAAMHLVPSERRGGFQTWIGSESNNSPYDSWVHGGAAKMLSISVFPAIRWTNSRISSLSTSNSERQIRPPVSKNHSSPCSPCPPPQPLHCAFGIHCALECETADASAERALSRCIWARRDCGLGRHLCSDFGGREKWGHFCRIVAVLPLAPTTSGNSPRSGPDDSPLPLSLLLSLAVYRAAGPGSPTARPALEHVPMMQHPVQHGGDGGAVAEQLSPVFHGSV
jgi:hypothetical protein